MDQCDVLDQIVDLLRQRKRLTYWLLKRQFALDLVSLLVARSRRQETEISVCVSPSTPS
jgi:hypothetical protein